MTWPPTRPTGSIQCDEEAITERNGHSVLNGLHAPYLGPAPYGGERYSDEIVELRNTVGHPAPQPRVMRAEASTRVTAESLTYWERVGSPMPRRSDG